MLLKTRLVLFSPLVIFFFISYKALLLLEQGQKLPTIFIITPTYHRPVQQPELIRLSQTLKLVSNVHWIVVEDAAQKTERLRHLLERTGIAYTHLATGNKQTACSGTERPGRGVTNREVGLAWLRQNAKDGVVFFADDDNSYDLRLFDEADKSPNRSPTPVAWSMPPNEGNVSQVVMLTEFMLDSKQTSKKFVAKHGMTNKSKMKIFDCYYM
ncbi:galactosylgalactosylxylosylprotein 3-beta-glucuronosyltransferase 2-like [Limulus polyphemus]|uniref:Galactosylgalactosylxylosylprotein 3-beta-glucuronosyltransferase n=1 Tax=Limulus polyphemus TaxID=6850 RepID=A0ABM1SXB6_LIMPO|nr:galactosylgalactosylxylosylprotein 3-beta-glucuronosyltransferase 2-like [Limulus polyphemus]